MERDAFVLELKIGCRGEALERNLFEAQFLFIIFLQTNVSKEEKKVFFSATRISF